jgi:rhamnosyltransferase
MRPDSKSNECDPIRNRCDEVCAVIVTFNPDPEVLRALLDRLLPQVGHAVLVDNGSKEDTPTLIADMGHENMSVRSLGQNFGLAFAQNVGIELAKVSGAEFVLLSDQDSVPEPDMVKILVGASHQLGSMGHEVAAVGPRYVDTRHSVPARFVAVEGRRVAWRLADSVGDYLEVNHLIASGCLIRMRALELVGGMTADLFIDYVDIDWALRARSVGLKLFGVTKTRLLHRIGDAPIAFGGRYFQVHSSVRHYYMMRNAVWVWKQPYAGWAWRIFDSYRILARLAFFSALATPRLEHMRMMVRGILDGLYSRMGPLKMTKAC